MGLMQVYKISNLFPALLLPQIGYKMSKFFLLTAALSGMISTGLGAFGAHALKSKLETSGYLQTYHTAVSYQFYHTLAILAVGILLVRYPDKWLIYSGYFFLVGLVLFSGSLYALCFTGIRWLGAITPLGGIGFILGWGFLALAAINIRF